MWREGFVCENDHSYVALLKNCSLVKDLQTGLRLHNEVLKAGVLEREAHIASALINMYVKCGRLTEAGELFLKLAFRNVVTWTTMITGYVFHGHDNDALSCYQHMQAECVAPNAITFVCTLKACGNLASAIMGQEIHAEIERKGLLKTNVILGSALVDMYGKCGLLNIAREVLCMLPVRNVISWTSLIAGYVEHHRAKEALQAFKLMQKDSLLPNAITLSYVVKACGIIEAIDEGQAIHTEIERRGMLGSNSVLGSALLDMYAKFGLFNKCQDVFDRLTAKNVISWTTLIAGYAQHGFSEEALSTFEEMQLNGVSPNALTLVCCLKACGDLGATEKGIKIHNEMDQKRLFNKNVFLGSSLVDMYAKCGLITKAQQVFDKLAVRNAVAWNALIAGYSQCANDDEALKCFEKMQSEGFSADAVSYISSLRACGNLGAIDKGYGIHASIVQKGMLECDIGVSSCLVDMYARSGYLATAEKVLHDLPVRGVVSWNSLMTGYSRLGENKTTLLSFNQMLAEGVNPDTVTFIVVLNACSRSGLVDSSQTYFEFMKRDCGILPTLKHHTCMINVLGHVGEIDMAITVIDKISLPSRGMWKVLLDTCKNLGNVDLGKYVFEHI